MKLTYLIALVLIALPQFATAKPTDNTGALLEFPGTNGERVLYENRSFWRQLKITYSSQVDPDNFSVTINGKDITRSFLPSKKFIQKDRSVKMQGSARLKPGTNILVFRAQSRDINPDTGKHDHQLETFTIIQKLRVKIGVLKLDPSEKFPKHLSAEELKAYLMNKKKMH